MKMFRSLKDVEHLRDILQSFEGAISETLGVITECCLLMRNHVRHSFAGMWLRKNIHDLILMHAFVGRSLSTSDKAKIDKLVNTLGGLGTEISDGFVRQMAVTTEYTKQKVEAMGEHASSYCLYMR